MYLACAEEIRTDTRKFWEDLTFTRRSEQGAVGRGAGSIAPGTDPLHMAGWSSGVHSFPLGHKGQSCPHMEP